MMSEARDIHEEIQADLASYALGSLENEEIDRIETHLRDCATCRDQLREYETIISILPLALAPVDPPAGARNRLLDRARRQRRWRLRRWLADSRWRLQRHQKIVAAIFVVLIGALVVWNLTLQFGENGAPQSNELTTVQIATLSGSESAPLATGHLVLAPEDGTSILVVSGLPALDSEHVYQLWFVQPDQTRVSGGIFRVDQVGAGLAPVMVPDDVFQFDRVGVTEEPMGGSPAPTGRNVLRGEL